MFNNCIFNFVILSNWSVKNLKPWRRKTQKHHARVLFFSFLVITYMKTAHTLIFTLDSTLQGKDWNIFSSRFRLVHACLAPATGCQSAAHFKVCFRIPHSKSRASGEKTAAWFKQPPGISFFFFFFLQAALCAQGIDGSSHGTSGSNARKSTAIAGDAAKSLPWRSDPGKQELGPTEAFSLREHRASAGRLVSILL